MASVTQLAQFLLKLNPQNSVARLAFYHWVKNLMDLESEFELRMIEQFYEHAMQVPYWQTAHRELGESVQADLIAFAHSHPLNFDLKDLRHVNTWQTIELLNGHDFYQVLKESNSNADPDKSKYVALSGQQILQIQVTAASGIDVAVYSNRVRIDGRLLKPLSPLTRLRYNSTLDLLPGVPQLLQTSHLKWARFQVADGTCHGLLLQGHTFQKTEAFMGRPVNQYPELYYSLKRLERHFIDLNSDPLYQELITMLEKANAMAGSHHPEATRLVEVALQKGQLAIKNIFPNDKLLTLLVTNLEYRITDGQPQRSAPASKPEESCQNLHPLP